MNEISLDEICTQYAGEMHPENKSREVLHRFISEREAKLKALLYDSEETFTSILEDMEHYKENGCIPTDDEINQIKNMLKTLILSRIKGD